MDTPLVGRAPFLTQHDCPRREGQGEALNLYSGELSAHRCGANICAPCVKVKARQIIRAVGASDPEAMLTLTLAAEEFTTNQHRMRMLRQSLQRAGYSFEWCWVVECNDERLNYWGNPFHDHHVHAVVHGGVPDPVTLSEHAQRAGFGRRADVRAADENAGTYVLKSFRKLKSPIDLPHRLWVNGGRLEHHTRGFIR